MTRLSLYEGEYILQTGPPYAVYDGAAAGCGFTNGAPTVSWSDPGALYVSSPACALWYEQLQWVVSRFHPDVTVIQTGYWETQNREFDGGFATLADADYSAYIESNLEEAVQIAHSDGGAVILSTSPYFDDGTPFNLVTAYNQIVEVGGRPVPLRVDRRPLHGPRPQWHVLVDGGRHRGQGGRRRAHHPGGGGRPH